MPRHVWPHAFHLFGATLNDADKSGRSQKALALLLRSYPKARRQKHSGKAVALRWSSTPLVGFPRHPFKVYRRAKTRKWENLSAEVAVNNDATIEWNLRGMYEVLVVAVPAANAKLRVDAFDVRHQIFPGQRIEFTAAGTGRFQVPGICGLRVHGAGTISAVFGVEQNALANENDWQLIEIVGLPYAQGEAVLPVYDPQLQGLAPGSLPGLEAAAVRLNIARILELPIPATGVADIPAPMWPAPNSTLYLNALRRGTIALFQLIVECLSNTNDADPNKMQADFSHTAKDLPGIRQLGAQGGGVGAEPTTVVLPVVASTILSVSTDCSAATALGYGTVDFPPVPTEGSHVPVSVLIREPTEPPGAADLPFDYMVTAEFVVPKIGSFEIAALAQGRAAPDAPLNLRAAAVHTNRPPLRDAPDTEAVRLKWDLSSQPQGYALIASHQPNRSEVLNAPRAGGGGFDLFTPLRPGTIDGDLPVGAQTSFVDQVAPVPFSGTSDSRYMAIGQDVFGRWSQWTLTTHPASAPAVTRPAIHAASFVQHPEQASGSAVPCEMEIEFSWDWADRSPDRIEFTGKFFPSSAAPDEKFDAGLAQSPTGQPGAALVVKFDNAGNPSISAGYTGTVEILKYDPPDPNDPPDVDQPRYRATISGFSCDFTNAPQLAFELYARGAERMRPNELSKLVGPKTTRTFDPLPPKTPALPVELGWTALPDATERARGLLKWPASPGAAGYVVWEATESALRHVLGAQPEEMPRGTALKDRAADLQKLINASADSQAASLHAFARLNTRIIPDTQMELALPGAASTIYAFRVSAVSASNVESAKSSTVALLAVPRRNQPGQPRLMLRAVKGKGVEVIVMPTPGADVAGYRVYRVRNEALISDSGLMGPAKYLEKDQGWRDYAVPRLHGKPEPGRALTDPVGESWYPYYYCVLAMGTEDLVNGEYSGASLPSAIQQIVLPPAQLILGGVSSQSNNDDAVITFGTNLPVRKTTLGPARIDLLRIQQVNNAARRVRVFSITPEVVPEGPALAPIANPPQLPQITRRAPDQKGIAEYTVMVKASDMPLTLMVTDPLGRTMEK